MADHGAEQQNARMNREMRAWAREPLSLRVMLADGSSAVTRDVSAGGLFLLVPPHVQIDSWMTFEFFMPEIGLKYVSEGEVVRVEPGEGSIGIALKLHNGRLVPPNLSDEG